MKKRLAQTVACIVLFAFALLPLGNASTLVENRDQPFSFKNDLARGEFEQAQKLFRLTHASYLASDGDVVEGEESLDVYGFKGKSVKRAFLYSLIVPGSGEFYAGSKIKAAVFLGLDVAFWALYFNYHGKGKDKETEYQGHADQYWSEDEYKQWLIDSLKITSDREYYKTNGDSAILSHHLPDSKTDQYYEMIGKYEQFRWGWTDYEGERWPDGSLKPSPRWNEYRNMREVSNNFLNKAKYSAMFSLANHILSAFDAALTVKRFNKRGEKFTQVEFKMRLVERNQEPVPRLSATIRF